MRKDINSDINKKVELTILLRVKIYYAGDVHGFNSHEEGIREEGIRYVCHFVVDFGE